MDQQYERIEPVEPCVSPDGHDHIEVFSYESPIPQDIVCSRCGKFWTIVVFDAR